MLWVTAAAGELKPAALHPSRSSALATVILQGKILRWQINMWGTDAIKRCERRLRSAGRSRSALSDEF